MKTNHTYEFLSLAFFKSKVNDYKLLAKFGLTTTVVISALFGFVMGMNGSMVWSNVLILIVAGYFITAASNAFNQILEKDTDKLMKRTADRPLPTGRMGATEALLFAGIFGFAGILMLWFFFNVNAALVGALSLFSYSFIYTPLKKLSSLSVFVGAFPGAFPVLIGYLAANGGVYNYDVIYLFAIQFIWQFPHFWSIAWISFDDYKNAGFHLLPTAEGKARVVPVLSLMYVITLVLLTVYYSFQTEMHLSIILGAIIIGLFFISKSILFLKHENDLFAKKLMIASIIYLPLLQLLYIIDKLIF